MSHFPKFDQFVELAKKSSVVTIYRRLSNDLLTPVNAFYKLDTGQNTFLLESVIGGDQIARYSFLAVDPFMHFEARGNDVEITPSESSMDEDWSPEGRYVGTGDPLDALQSIADRFHAEHVPNLPRFVGGAVGYMGYDTVRYTENLPSAPPDDRKLPDMAFDFYDSVVVFDHVDKTVTVTGHAHVSEAGTAITEPKKLRTIYDATCRKVDAIVERLNRSIEMPLVDVDASGPVQRGCDRSNFEREQFYEAVRRCKQYIVAGDIFQVVISQRFETETAASPFSIYRALRVVNPSPYMFYLRIGEMCLVGSSPELMVKVEDGLVTTRPLAGTRPRGATPEEDKRLEAELLADEKERAEHVMLVDLGRNDVGRVAELGTVQLPEVMTIERYSHVMHISSTVTGQMADGRHALDAVRACLPAGTVSGAPKVRAMQIIDELEPNRRGPYAGAVGFIDFTGNLETCLALRTMVCLGNKAYIQAGAGIVADSVPEREYEETINKAKGLLKAIEVAEGWQ